jgi:hypothetical protein
VIGSRDGRIRDWITNHEIEPTKGTNKIATRDQNAGPGRLVRSAKNQLTSAAMVNTVHAIEIVMTATSTPDGIRGFISRLSLRSGTGQRQPLATMPGPLTVKYWTAERVVKVTWPHGVGVPRFETTLHRKVPFDGPTAL